MPQTVDSLTSILEHLTERVRDLDCRVTALESHTRVAPDNVLPSGSSISSRASEAAYGRSRTSALTIPSLQHSRPAMLAAFPGFENASVPFTVIGKAVLGFAGAFLLRALAESRSVPKLPVLVAAILYACFWMIWSARSSDRFTRATYAVTSVLILCPMLWEATVRFQSMSPTASAVVLAGFAALTLVLAAGRELQLIPWVAMLGTASTSIVLIIGTRQLIPFTAALLAIAAVTEISLCLGHELTFRAIPAIFADFSIWLLIYILGSGTVPEGYSEASVATLVAFCATLPGIYAVSIAVRSFIQLRPMTVFEIVQTAASFPLAAFGILSASNNAASPALGAIFGLVAAVCYWGSLSRFAGNHHTRNRRVTASWAAAMLVAAMFLLLPEIMWVPFLCLAALVTAGIYTRTARLSLGLHASIYLATAAGASSLAMYIWSALAGIVPSTLNWGALIVALAAALCYALESHYSIDEGRRRLLWLIPAGLVAFTIAALGVAATVRLAAGHIDLAASHLSMIRTIVICLLALGLGLASRRRHIELRWIAYAALALGTLKLLWEDLRFGNPASLVVSFVFYGLILILLPRLTRSAKSAQ